MKIAHDASACVAFPGIVQIDVARDVTGSDSKRLPEILTDEIGVVGDNGSSGFHALNLAIQFGATRIVLVGFDMRLDYGVHWHGPHPKGLNNPSEMNVESWRKSFDAVAGRIRDLGVTVINASPVSTLTAYPKMTLAEALQC